MKVNTLHHGLLVQSFLLTASLLSRFDMMSVETEGNMFTGETMTATPAMELK